MAVANLREYVLNVLVEFVKRMTARANLPVHEPKMRPTNNRLAVRELVQL